LVPQSQPSPSRVARILGAVRVTRRLPEAHYRRRRHGVHVESARTLGYWNRVQLDFSRPGKPVDKAFIEVFGTFRRECLASHWFLRLDDLQRTLQTLQDDYNNQRLLSGLADVPRPKFRAVGGSALGRRQIEFHRRSGLDSGRSDQPPRTGPFSAAPSSHMTRMSGTLQWHLFRHLS